MIYQLVTMHLQEMIKVIKLLTRRVYGLSVSYTQGGMTIKAHNVSMDNVGGSSTATEDDIDGYKVSVSFAF